MKGIIGKIGAAGCLAAAWLGAQGCATYDQVVDRCYPQRYNHMAHDEVLQALGTQVHNGHILEQTVWNSDFEPGTDRLTPGGLERLASLARRRPTVDTTVFLQVAQDVYYDPASPERFIQARNELDSLRVVAVQKYLNAETDGRGLAFKVVVHDPPDISTDAISQGVAIQQEHLSTQGVLKQLGGSSGGASAGR